MKNEHWMAGNSADTFGVLASPSARSYNRRVSGFGASHLRPNPRFARTSDTRRTLYESAALVLRR